MIVGPLKKGLQSALPVLIPFFILFICLVYFSVNNSLSIDSRNILYNLLQKQFLSAWIIFIVNIFCLVAGSFLISVLTIKHEIADKQNYLPAFLYLFFSSLVLDKNLLHPALIANIFILVALNSLIDTYRDENVLSKIFNAAFFTILAVFFYLNYAFFIFLFFIGLIILRPFNWRELAMSIFGFIAPVFMYICFCYLINADYIVFFTDLFDLLSFFQKPLISEYYYPLLFALCILLVLCTAKHFSKGFGGKVKTQKAISIIYWFLLLSFINFFSKNNDYYFPTIASTIPLSILFSDYFYNIKQLKISNTLFFLLLASGSVLFLMRFHIF